MVDKLRCAEQYYFNNLDWLSFNPKPAMKNLLLIFGSLCLFHTAKSQYILTMNFEDMDPYLGKTMVTRVTEQSGGKEVGRKTIDSIGNADFSFDLYVLLEGKNYTPLTQPCFPLSNRGDVGFLLTTHLSQLTTIMTQMIR
jgi:hypothetical protein